MGGTVRAKEGIADIASQGEAAFIQRGSHAGSVNAVNLFQDLPSSAKLVSAGIEKTEPKGAQHAGSAVVGGTSTNADKKIAATLLQSVNDKLAGAKGVGFQRIPFFRSK